jgi:glutamate 5-kinase
MNDRSKLKNRGRIVIKVGTSTISFENGRMNFTRLEKITMVLSDIINSGREVVLVSSGAIGVGAGRLKMEVPPDALVARQALAAIGQAELIRIYQKFFDEYNQMVAQVLLTRDGLDDEIRAGNAKNTLNELLRMKIIPIVNENDTVSTAELQFGDNDTLSAKVAALIEADLLIILSDIDGLYTGDPKNGGDAEIIRTVTEITPEIENFAEGSTSSFTKGGMKTKINAARICMASGVDVVIINGSDPSTIHSVFAGEETGTYFIAKN